MRLRHITMTIECEIKTIIQSHKTPKKKCNDLKTSHAAVCVCCGQEKIISLTSSSCSCPSSYPVSSSFWRQRQPSSWRQRPSSSWQLQPCFSFSCQLQPSSWQRPPSS